LGEEHPLEGAGRGCVDDIWVCQAMLAKDTFKKTEGAGKTYMGSITEILHEYLQNKVVILWKIIEGTFP